MRTTFLFVLPPVIAHTYTESSILVIRACFAFIAAVLSERIGAIDPISELLESSKRARRAYYDDFCSREGSTEATYIMYARRVSEG